MAYAYDAGMIERVMPRVKQWEATTGRRITPSMLEALIKGQLDAEVGKAQQTRALDIQQQGVDLSKQQAADAKSANKAAGITGAISTAANIGLTYKYLSKPSTTASTGAQTGMAGGAPVTGAQTQLASTAPLTTDAGSTAAYDASLAEGASEGVGSTTGTTAAPSVYSGGGASAYGTGAGVAAGTAAGLATNYVVTKTGEGKASNARVADWSKAAGMTSWSDADYASKGSATVGGLAGGGAFGAAGANVVWDFGKAFQTGKISNELLGIPYADKIANTDVGSIFDTVICSELLRQGKITERQRQVCVVFRFRHISNDMFCAYLEWAAPIVSLMKKGGVINKILLPFAKAFIGYMLSIQAKRIPSLVERMVWKYAWSRCKSIVRKYASTAMQGVA